VPHAIGATGVSRGAHGSTACCFLLDCRVELDALPGMRHAVGARISLFPQSGIVVSLGMDERVS
jgi:hypothetical protein